MVKQHNEHVTRREYEYTTKLIRSEVNIVIDLQNYKVAMVQCGTLDLKKRRENSLQPLSKRNKR